MAAFGGTVCILTVVDTLMTALWTSHDCTMCFDLSSLFPIFSPILCMPLFSFWPPMPFMNYSVTPATPICLEAMAPLPLVGLLIPIAPQRLVSLLTRSGYEPCALEGQKLLIPTSTCFPLAS